MHYAPVSLSFLLFLSTLLPPVTLLTSLQSNNFAIFKTAHIFFFNYLSICTDYAPVSCVILSSRKL